MTLLAKDESEQERGYKFNKIIRGDIRKQRIALTFDDGPHPVYTLQLLDILRRTHTPATFFVVGRQVEKNPALVQLEVAEGHEVGNHTYDHVNLTLIPPELIGLRTGPVRRRHQEGDRLLRALLPPARRRL